MWKEFKEFALKGNVIDMAAGIVIGVAFGKIITSLVNDIIMPPLGLLLGKLDFLIVALAIFVMIKQINRLKAKPQPVPVNTKECPFCWTQIPLKAVRCPNCTSVLSTDADNKKND